MDIAGITATGKEELLRTVEESADAANLLGLEAVLGRFEAVLLQEGALTASEQLVETADCTVRATARMAHLMRSSGLF